MVFNVKAFLVFLSYAYSINLAHGNENANSHQRSITKRNVLSVEERLPNDTSSYLTMTSSNGCVFPFYYNGVPYYDCIYKEPVGGFYGRCSTSYIGKHYTMKDCWVYGEMPELVTYTYENETEPCVFPFTFMGKTYQECSDLFTARSIMAPLTQHGYCSLTTRLDVDRTMRRCQSFDVESSSQNDGQCVFPFWYLGQLQYNCMPGGWCSLTNNFDRDLQSANCPLVGLPTTTAAPTTTVSTNPPPSTMRTYLGGTCILPFRYNNRLYHSCTTDNHSRRRKWCLTRETYLWGNWDLCVVPENEGIVTKKGEKCIFPFSYYGKEWNGCTVETTSGRYFCKTRSGYGYCSVADTDSSLQWIKENGLRINKVPIMYGNPFQRGRKPQCSFPFVRNGKLTASCFSEGNRHLCSTTHNYDRDKKATDCKNNWKYFSHVGVKGCHFPFWYKENYYISPASGFGKDSWCAHDFIYQSGRWHTVHRW